MKVSNKKLHRIIAISILLLLTILGSGCSIILDLVKEGQDLEKESDISANYHLEGKELPENHPYLYRAEFEEKMIDLVNKHRQENGLHPLEERVDLRDTARYKSLSMLQLSYFSHENPNFENKDMDHLIWDVFGYKHYKRIGENLAFISSSLLSDKVVEEIFNNLKESPGHNENMLRESFDFIGVGIVYSRSSSEYYKGLPTVIVTQHFGKYK